MTLTYLLLILAAMCALWGLVSAILLTRALDQRGMPTPFLFLGLYLFRNLGRYRAITVQETGKVGPLFYLFVGPVNLAWILALIALLSE